MQYFFAIISFLCAVLILVSVHEFGHFIVAKFCKIKVLRFSIGFGKPLLHFYDKQKTEYVIAAIPLGGYVKLLDEREAPVALVEQSQAFNRHPIYQRFAVMIAGVLFNLIFAFFAFWLVLSVGMMYVRPIIGNVLPNSPVATIGLKAGAEITAIDHRPTPTWNAIAMALLSHYGTADPLLITAQTEEASNHIKTTVFNIDAKQWHLNALRPDPLSSLGIIPYRSHQLFKLRYPVWTAASVAFDQTTAFFKFNIMMIYKMVTGVISWKGMGGPLTIFEASALSAGQGIIVYINFLALLSISIAIVNLLPIPGLDGLQIIYLLIEFIRRKPISIATQVLLFRLGVIVLALLMTTVLMNDLLRLV